MNNKLFLILMIIAFFSFLTGEIFNGKHIPDSRIFAFQEGEIAKTVIGNLDVMIVKKNTYTCIGGGCPAKNSWPKMYEVRLPDGRTAFFAEYELKKGNAE